jgi:hypothetical protein
MGFAPAANRGLTIQTNLVYKHFSHWPDVTGRLFFVVDSQHVISSGAHNFEGILNSDNWHQFPLKSIEFTAAF